MPKIKKQQSIWKKYSKTISPFKKSKGKSILSKAKSKSIFARFRAKFKKRKMKSLGKMKKLKEDFKILPLQKGWRENPIKIGSTVFYKKQPHKVEGPLRYKIKEEPYLFIIGGNPRKQKTVHPKDIKEFNALKNMHTEDAPVNSAGGGNVAGIGVGPDGEPGRSKSNIIRRKFAGHEVFEVDTHRFMECRMGKAKYHRYSKYVGTDEIGEAIRQYGRNNPKKPIIIQDNKTSAMIYLKY